MKLMKNILINSHVCLPLFAGRKDHLTSNSQVLVTGTLLHKLQVPENFYVMKDEKSAI